jgi:hypothetical protein
VKLPPAPLKYDQTDEANNRRLLYLADEQNLKNTQDVILGGHERLVLRSANGSLWIVSVSNAGALSAIPYVKP